MSYLLGILWTLFAVLNHYLGTIDDGSLAIVGMLMAILLKDNS